MIIHGGKPLHGAVIDSKKDHRIAMTSSPLPHSALPARPKFWMQTA
ncbi:MAG: hypothetical protein ACLR8P_11055 [Clostridium fessum]